MTFIRKGGRRQTAPLNAAAPGVLRGLAADATTEGFLFHNWRGHSLSATDAFTARDLLGHSKVDTSDIYVTSAFEEQRRAVDALCGNMQEFRRAFTTRRQRG